MRNRSVAAARRLCVLAVAIATATTPAYTDTADRLAESALVLKEGR